MIYIFLFILFIALLALIFTFMLMSVFYKSEHSIQCPHCDSPMLFNIRDEQTKDNLHIVDYYCPKCGCRLTLPPDKKN